MIYRSPYPDVSVPGESLSEFVFGGLSDRAQDHLAVVCADTGRAHNYRQLVDDIARMGAALSQRGLGPNGVAALFAPNRPEFPLAFHGVLVSGAAVSLVNILCTSADLARQLRDCRASVLITTHAQLPTARDAVIEPGVEIQEIIILDGESTPTRSDHTSGIAETSLAELLTQAVPTDAPPIAGDDLAALPYSSGTTGTAKGVMLTHRNLAVNVLQMQPIGQLGPDSRVLAVLPMFHIYGLTAIMNQTLYRRAQLITLSRYELGQMLTAIETHRVDHLYIAPPIALALTQSPLVDTYDLSSLRVVVCGAAPLDRALAETLAERLNATVLQGYGLTESSPCTHGIPVERHDIDRGSIGVPMPNIEARVIDPATGRDAAPGQPGELWCRGPNIMAGYHNNPDATAATIDADGFLHTGDLVTVDAQGVFRVVDRLKELIKYKGYQVAPAELEALLLTHPKIADAAVVGARDADGQEVPKAFVVRSDPDLSAEQVSDFVAARVAPHKKIRAVAFIDRIPKSPTGKILRASLRNG